MWFISLGNLSPVFSVSASCLLFHLSTLIVENLPFLGGGYFDHGVALVQQLEITSWRKQRILMMQLPSLRLFMKKRLAIDSLPRSSKRCQAAGTLLILTMARLV